MKINYNKNPLRTTIDLDEHEKKEYWYKVKLEEYEHLLAGAHFYLMAQGEWFDIDRAREHVDTKQIFDEGRKTFDERVTALHESYLNELQGFHCGDCTCQAMTCWKCLAESCLGVDTMPGLRSHEAIKIEHAFGKNNEKSLDEAIITLEQYKPTVNWKGAEAHIDRWTEEGKRACEWLKKYRDEHFK